MLVRALADSFRIGVDICAVVEKIGDGFISFAVTRGLVKGGTVDTIGVRLFRFLVESSVLDHHLADILKRFRLIKPVSMYSRLLHTEVPAAW